MWHQTHNFTSLWPLAACVNANLFHLQVNIHTPLEKVVTCHFNSANSHSSSKFAQVFKHRQHKRWTLPLWRHPLVLNSTFSTFDAIRHICFSSLNVPYIIQQAIILSRWLKILQMLVIAPASYLGHPSNNAANSTIQAFELYKKFSWLRAVRRKKTLHRCQNLVCTRH